MGAPHSESLNTMFEDPPTAFVSPFLNPSNEYIELQKLALAELGYNVKPFELKALLSRDGFGVFSPRNVIFLNWLESRCTQGGKLSLTGVLIVHLYLAVLLISRAKVVYVIHNHKAHDSRGMSKAITGIVIRWLRLLSDEKIVHSRGETISYSARYVPHPVYWEHRQHELPIVSMKFDFVVLGAIRPYKGIHRLLEVWPRGKQLLIKGSCDESYLCFLREIISKRDLSQSVQVEPGFVSESDYRVTLRSTRCLILPHEEGTALVSGAFFEAVGVVPIILMRTSPFAREVETMDFGVLTFKSDNELKDLVQHLEPKEKQVTSSVMDDIRERALKEFGISAVKMALRVEVLGRE